LLKSVDIMREMRAPGTSPIDAQRVADLQFDLELAIVQNKAPAAAAVVSAQVAAIASATPAASERAASVHRWRIQFRPYPQLFAHGNDPLRMLRELADLGDLQVTLPPKRTGAVRARSGILLSVLGADRRH
jgi:two-component system chemotaxis sensor kinase CheA